MDANFPDLTAEPAKGPTWVSMRHLQHAVVFLTAQGLDADALLGEAGLSRTMLEDGERQLPLQAMEDLLAVTQHRHPDPLVGLHLARNIQPATLGALGFLLQSCATVADLLDVAVRFNGLMSNFGHTSVVHSAGMVEIRWDCRAGSPLLRRHAMEYMLGTFVVVGRLLAPGDPQPVAVQFPHPHPGPACASREYFDVFQCPVHFGRSHAGVLAPRGLVERRLPHGDAVLKDLLERHARELLDSRRQAAPLAQDVQRLLKALVLAGVPSKEAVAAQLGTSTRTLHRRLQEAGTSYREQLDATRQALACTQLASSDTSIADIAERLGFSSPQAFMRWFLQRVGTTPGQYRRNAQALAD